MDGPLADCSDLNRPGDDLRAPGNADRLDPLDNAPPALVADSFRLALAEERETVRKTYLEVAELRHRLNEAEGRVKRLKKSLTFMLGDAIVATRTPKDFMTLGLRLLNAYRGHQKRKAQPRRAAPAAPISLARRAAALQQALMLARSRGCRQAAQWTHSNVRNTKDRARILVEIGMAALPSDPATASELAAESARLFPGSIRTKALMLSIEAVKADLAENRQDAVTA